MAVGDSLTDVIYDIVNEGFLAIFVLIIYITITIYCFHNIYIAIAEYGYIN